MRELGFITVGPNGVIKVRRENGDHAFIDNANLGTLLSKLATAGWRLAPGQDVDHKIAQTILVRGLVEIEVERPAFYDEPEGPAPMRYASVELDGTENREVIQKRFERNA